MSRQYDSTQLKNPGKNGNANLFNDTDLGHNVDRLTNDVRSVIQDENDEFEVENS